MAKKKVSVQYDSVVDAVAPQLIPKGVKYETPDYTRKYTFTFLIDEADVLKVLEKLMSAPNVLNFGVDNVDDVTTNES